MLHCSEKELITNVASHVIKIFQLCCLDKSKQKKSTVSVRNDILIKMSFSIACLGCSTYEHMSDLSYMIDVNNH